MLTEIDDITLFIHVLDASSLLRCNACEGIQRGYRYLPCVFCGRYLQNASMVPIEVYKEARKTDNPYLKEIE